METIIIVAAVLISLVIGILVGVVIRKKIAESKINGAEEEAKKLVELAKIEADNLKKEEIFKAKEEIMNARNELDKEIKERRGEIQKQESRIIQKEENLERRSDNFEKKEKDLEREEQNLNERKQDVENLYTEQMKVLQDIAKLTQEEAKDQLLKSVEQDITSEKAALIRDLTQKAKDEALKNGREIVAYAIQKCAADHSAETTVSIVPLPSDDVKGRIIGREGRNIRALETLTGIDLIIDDTPEAVILSGFDPLRREVARIALEKLIQDGRIHPTRIGDMVEKARKEVDQTIKKEGENAVFTVGVHGIHPELVKLLGRLRYRTSFGQNVLKHSIEVAQISGLIAGELGVDVTSAKRAGLLHDIGKALDQEKEGSHVSIGVEEAKRYKESSAIVHAIEAHHGDVEVKSILAAIVQAADAISAARPGARREDIENYIKRLERLEGLANDFEGVEKTYAIQAGREIRVMVRPEEVSDDSMIILARNIANKIEQELEYPGQIKVNVIRENRAVEYAK